MLKFWKVTLANVKIKQTHLSFLTKSNFQNLTVKEIDPEPKYYDIV